MADASRITVREVVTPRDLARFIDFAYRHYESDPVWVPPLRRDVHKLLTRAGNPFFEHAEAAYFLCERGSEVVGRIAAIENRLHNQVHGDRVGFFGFYEAVDDHEVARRLVDAAASWCGARGLSVLRGPASFSVNHECGLLVENFTAPPTFMMPYNPPYYVAQLEAAGFITAKNLLVYQGGDENQLRPVPDRLTRGTDVIRRRQGITLRALDLNRYSAEVEQIKALYNGAWEKNWGFVPMTDREIDVMAEEFRPVVVPDLVPFAIKDDKVIGFALALPDLNVALRANRGGGFLGGALRILWYSKLSKIHRARILLLGILPEFRGIGVDAMLYHWIWTKAGGLGYWWGEAGWILEDNPAMNQGLIKMGFEVYRKYRFYDRPIG